MYFQNAHQIDYYVHQFNTQKTKFNPYVQIVIDLFNIKFITILSGYRLK